MEVDIYKATSLSSATEKVHIFVPSGSSVEELPDDLKERAGELVFEKQLEINPGDQRIALDADEAIRNIDDQGFHVQGSKIETSINT